MTRTTPRPSTVVSSGLKGWKQKAAVALLSVSIFSTCRRQNDRSICDVEIRSSKSLLIARYVMHLRLLC